MVTYIALFSAPLSRLTELACGSTWVTSFIVRFFEYPLNWCTYSAGMAGAIWNCSRLGASSVYTILHAPCHFMQSHIRKVYACLAVTCHLHFWQNDRDLLRATAVTWGWNGYQNKSLHRKSTLEKKILPPLLQGFEPATFQSWVRCSNHWAIPAPCGRYVGALACARFWAPNFCPYLMKYYRCHFLSLELIWNNWLSSHNLFAENKLVFVCFVFNLKKEGKRLFEILHTGYTWLILGVWLMSGTVFACVHFENYF